MKLISIGDVAPDFNLKDNHDQEIKLSDYRGQKVLLSWHPLAWTSVCTDQMRALDANYETFQRLNTVAIGLSVDPAPSKKAWATAIALSHLSIPSDFWPHGKVAQDYGIFIEKFGFSERANIIIDEKGIVRWVKIYPIKQLPDINEVISVLSNL